MRRCAYAPCGEPIDHMTVAAIYCSRRCKERAHMARRGGRTPEMTICRWCRQPLTRVQKAGRPRSYHEGCARDAARAQAREWTRRRNRGLDLRSWHVTEDITDYIAAPYLAAMRGDPCTYCGGEGGHLDHIEPVTRRRRRNRDDGIAVSREWANLSGSCQACNSRKYTYSMLAALITGRLVDAAAPLLAELRAWRGPGAEVGFR